jgi:hypothetical protein
MSSHRSSFESLRMGGKVRLLALGLAVLLAACGGGGDDSGGGGDGSPLVQMLGAVPDTPDAAQFVSYSDLDAYYDALGVGAPPQGAGEEFDDWLRQVNQAEAAGDVAPLIGGAQFALDAFRYPQDCHDEIGVDAADIHQAIEAGAPPEVYTVVRGDFDSGDVDDAVKGDDNFSDLLETETHGGVDFYTWGEDFAQDLSRNSPVHTLGRGGRLAFSGGLLFWCFWTSGMTGMIDAAADAAPSLADRADYGAIAAALDAAGAYTAQFTDQTVEGTDDRITVLAPFASFAAGGGVDGSEPFMVIVLANADEATATDNAERLVQRIEVGKTGGITGEAQEWAQGIGTVETRAEGSLTVATLRGTDLPWDFVASGSDMLMHEPEA